MSLYPGSPAVVTAASQKMINIKRVDSVESTRYYFLPIDRILAPPFLGGVYFFPRHCRQ